MRFVLAALLFSTTSLAQSTPSDSLDLSSLKMEKVVTLTSTPEKAEVYTIGPNRQKTLLCKATPCKRNLEVKAHSLLFVHEGFEVELRTLRVAESTRLHAVFESPYAQIRFSVTPKNSQISINGGQAQSSDQTFTLAPGAHTVQISDSCVEGKPIRFNVKNGQNEILKIQGTPLVAGLQISATDSENNAVEAELFIDGVLIGSVPGVYKVPACAKNLEVRKGRLLYRENPRFQKNKIYKKQVRLGDKAKLERLEKKRKADQRKADGQLVEDAGLMGANMDMGGAEGNMGATVAEANLDGIGGVFGSKGNQRGAGGLASRGDGMGGGGTGAGLGGSGTRGRGAGSSGYGSGGGNFRRKSAGGFGRIGGNAIIMGALDKSLIDRVIKQHMNQIKYCYQKQLNANPTLGGKITVKFVITGDGTVSSAKTAKSTLSGNGASSVNNCINQRFLAFQFPKPKGGGMVIVKYPFIFQPK